MGGNSVRRLASSSAILAVCLVTATVPRARAEAQRVATASARPNTVTRVTLDFDNAPVRLVIQSIARQAGLKPSYDATIIPSHARVTLHAKEIPVHEAFQQALSGTGLAAHVQVTGNVIIVPDEVIAQAGAIIGKVIDAKTHQGLRGATVSINGTVKGTTTGDDGRFRLSDLAPGSYNIQVRILGYVKTNTSVTVAEGETSTIEISLEPSVNALDQVVVTGTVVPTELKAVPNAISVITAQQIEERGITRIDQLFRGDIPGLFAQRQGSGTRFDEVTMYSRGATGFGGVQIGNKITQNTNVIKTYVDGVEMADPKYLSQIDPKSVERIEILTGPQASTIYGSNAINGVMQIFTKRGTASRPQLALNLMSGWVENNFSSARTPQHDYSAQVNGVASGLSYNAGGSWNYMGPWTPARQTANTGGFGGANLEVPTTLGRVTANMTLRRSVTRNIQRGDAQQTLTDYRETGWYTANGRLGLAPPTTHTLISQTLGVGLRYAPTSWWSHDFELGMDASDAETRRTARGYINFSDTTLLLEQDHTDRTSLQYLTTVRIPLTSQAQATVIMGADAWRNLTSSNYIYPQTLTGFLFGDKLDVRQPGHNAGGFLRTQFGFHDRLFLTYGLRAEWNPGFGAEVQPNYAPQMGVSYVQDIGTITAKVRGSYGRSTRPPAQGLKSGIMASEVYRSDWFVYYAPYYPDYEYIKPNPGLAPEHQRGVEGGLELYFGTRGSLVVTRYNQTVDGLISNVSGVDSVDILPEARAQFGLGEWEPGVYVYEQQYLNVGSIRNQGWELQGSVNIGPISTRGTYSWTKSRTIGVNPLYKSLFTPSAFPQYQPGASFRFLPEHTWAWEVRYARAGTTVGINVMGVGRATNQGDDFYARNANAQIRLLENRVNMNLGVSPSSYINFNRAYALADLSASHRFLPRIDGVFQVQNLANFYKNDNYAGYASMGRQTKLGVRIRTN